MKISCPACSAKYSIADEKVKDRLAKIRCRKCGTTIVIDGKMNPPVVQAADAGGHALAGDAGHGGAHPNPEYSVDFGENDQRTMSLDALVAAYNDGLVTADTFVWAESFEDWKPLGEVEEIVEALHSAAQAEPDEERPAPVAPSSPWDSRGRADVPVRAATKASGQDLFGRIEHVGSEADVTTSAPEDLPMATATGARNESSVLFSLSALTSAANASRPSQPPMAMTTGSSGSRDDSGLIDLKALTEAAARSETAQPQVRVPTPVLGVAPLGMAPLGVAGPLGGVMATASGASFDAPAPAKNRNGLLIGGGFVIAALVIAGAIVLTRPAAPPPAPPPVAALPAPVPIDPPAVDQKAEALAAAAKKAEEDKAKAEAEEKAKAQAQAGRRWRPPPPKGDSSPTTTTKTSTPSGDDGEKKKPPKKGNPCGCAPSDLQCNMRCAAGG